MDIDIKKKLERGELRIIVLQKDSDPNIQYDIFMRLNTGAVKLNEQELRNCLYRGSLNNLIKGISRNNQYVKLLFPNNTDRMFACEMILRYLAVSESYNKAENSIQNYDGRIKNLINNYMQKHQNDGEVELDFIKKKFEAQIEKAYCILGSMAFKKNDKTTKPNASLYECVMIAFEDYALDKLLLKQIEIVHLVKELLNNAEFLQSIDKATGNTEVLKRRHYIFRKHLGEIMDDAGKRRF